MSQEIPEYVKKCVREAAVANGFNNFKIIPEGTTDKGDGYATDIYFVKVEESNGQGAHLAVKTSKDFKSFTFDEAQEFYRREKYVYSDVFPAYRKFESEKLGKDCLSYVPLCYGTFEEEGKVILVFENLRKKNYRLHDRQKSMNQQHIEEVLKRYAHFHALSLTFRDQNPEKFKELTKDYNSMYLNLFYGPFGGMFDLCTSKHLKHLKKYDEDLVQKLEKSIEKGAKRIAIDILKEPLEEFVITHGDCWNNNFLFHYEEGIEEIPSGVMVLDWQISSLQSPVMDLVQFLFLTISPEQVLNFEYYKNFYYDNLAKNITNLGSDSDKVFPIEKFTRDWKKYSIYGLICTFSMIDVICCDKDKIMDINEFENQEEMAKAFSGDHLSDRSAIDERLMALARYYVRSNEL